MSVGKKGGGGGGGSGFGGEIGERDGTLSDLSGDKSPLSDAHYET